MTSTVPEPAETPAVDPRPCQRLRSKKYFFLTRAPRSADDLLDGSRTLWCSATQQAIGPDSALVTALDCRVGRGCFRGERIEA